MDRIPQPPISDVKRQAVEATLAFCLDLARLCEWTELLIAEANAVNLEWYEPPYPGVDSDHIRGNMLVQVRQWLKWGLSDLKKAKSAIASPEFAGRQWLEQIAAAESVNQPRAEDAA